MNDLGRNCIVFLEVLYETDIRSFPRRVQVRVFLIDRKRLVKRKIVKEDGLGQNFEKSFIDSIPELGFLMRRSQVPVAMAKREDIDLEKIVLNHRVFFEKDVTSLRKRGIKVAADIGISQVF